MIMFGFFGADKKQDSPAPQPQQPAQIDPEEKHTILKMAEAFIKELSPLKVILFGSFASGQYSESSDYDFYIVVDDDFNKQQIPLSVKAHKSIRNLKTRPVDIIVDTATRFNNFAQKPSYVEYSVAHNGVVLYER